MAQILDLNAKEGNPIKGERYFVDTNVWYWTTYIASKGVVLPDKPADYQINSYPKFIEKAKNEGAILCHCPLTLAELANLIENIELDIYRAKIKDEYFEKKKFRLLESERKEVLSEINVAWSSISALSKCLAIELDDAFATKVCAILENGSLDPFDAFYLEIMRTNNIDYIVTDDHDFSINDSQIVVTANRKALRNS